MSQEKSVSIPDYSEDIKYHQQQIDRLNKKVRILIAILTEKKMIGEAMAKVIEETEAQNTNPFKLDEKSLEWLLS